MLGVVGTLRLLKKDARLELWPVLFADLGKFEFLLAVRVSATQSSMHSCPNGIHACDPDCRVP